MSDAPVLVRSLFTRRKPLLLAVFLPLLTFLAYWPLQHNSLTEVYDDWQYIVGNPHVTSGITRANVVWAFSQFYAANYHPLTWLSHMLDYRLFGLDPGGHHLTSLMLHILNTLILFAFLRYVTGALWRSFFVALLFAVHPLHVESVAWAAERKDVLSTFFGLLTLFSYAASVRSGKKRYYGLCIILYALSLLSKPMLVTLPFLLLLLDWWPLDIDNLVDRCIAWVASLRKGHWDGASCLTSIRLLLAKTPFFLLCIASCVVTVHAQRAGSAVVSLADFPMSVRLTNASTAYLLYIWKTILPVGLSVMYPHPGTALLWKSLLTASVLLLITFACLRRLRFAPYLTFGWLWYLGTLVPVIGLVQVGVQAIADRYTYIPLIGLFIALSWSMEAFHTKFRGARALIPAGAVLVVLSLIFLTSRQVKYWRDDHTLFSRALETTTGNYIAHNNLGIYFARNRMFPSALDHFGKAIEIKPDYAKAYANLGKAHVDMGSPLKGIPLLDKALSIEPGLPTAFLGLAMAYATIDSLEPAIANYKKAIELSSEGQRWMITNNLGTLYADNGRFQEALQCFHETLSLRPGEPKTCLNRARVLLELGNTAPAIDDLATAIELTPADARLRYDIGVMLEEFSLKAGACALFAEAAAMCPDEPLFKKRLDSSCDTAYSRNYW